jgi:hypothetical protein
MERAAIARAGGLALLASVGMSSASQAYTFQTLNNPADDVNVLLGINDAGVIAGTGSAFDAPPSGYAVAPPYAPSSYTPVNYPGSDGTVPTGVNNADVMVGFFMSGANTYGFSKVGGSYVSVSDPNTPTTGLAGTHRH